MRSFPTTLLLVLALFSALPLAAQAPNGTINGLVTDSTSRAIVGADIVIVNDATGIQYASKTSGEGIYVVPNLPPGVYRLQVSKIGFKTLIKPDIVLNVQDALSINFTLPIGALSETITVQGGAPLVNTQDASVSTVIDRQFAENLPMNGRSFQTLIELTPGVVVTPSSFTNGGQFSVNGQRTTSNYWMVDGVSANIGISAGAGPGNGLGGSLGSFSAVGGTNSLVSVDALQEFRIQTSTYAPEFGRTPGGQISIVTRSGTNQFHGTAFDYIRNDFLDANNWFSGFTNHPALPKAKERQNDFGGTLSGPILRNRTFFFFSYEGLRLRLPQTALTTVPDMAARQNAIPAMQPFLNAFPKPNGTDDTAAGTAQFNTGYSNPAILDAYSIRLDHRIGDRLALFGRYNYSPSEIDDRGGLAGTNALSSIQSLRITTQTATLGITYGFSPRLMNDLRFNYSRTSANGDYYFDDFGGAVPLTVLPFPAPFTAENAQFGFAIFSLTNDNGYSVGKNAQNTQRQVNLVDGLSWQRGTHSFKFGVDFRRLTPQFRPLSYSQGAAFSTVSDSESGNHAAGLLQANNGATLLFRNLGIYAQDTWRASSRLTLTYGLRWDLEPPPATEEGPSIPALLGYSLVDFSQLAIAPAGTPPFHTTYSNFAPRLGVTYQLTQSRAWQTVASAGAGVFYDSVGAETGNVLANLFPPFGSTAIFFNASFPLTSAQAAPPPIPTSGTLQQIDTFNPNLKLPYTVEWNVALEQSLGSSQALSLHYVGAAGRRLVQTTVISGPLPSNPNLGFADFIDNTSSSRYDALQIQFQRRLTAGLQGLAAYTWSHSIDDASAGAYSTSNNGVPGSNLTRGNSSFDIRSAFNAALTYDIPVPRTYAFFNAILRGWSTETLILARSAPPVDVSDAHFFQFTSGTNATVRPDLVPGQPLYLYGPLYPGGKALNKAAFSDPPKSGTSGAPSRQGNLPRNFLRGFGAVQWDFAVHRDFPIYDTLKLQFRAELFNVLNHPNFGPPNGQFGRGGFGRSSQMLGQSLNGNNLGGGAFSSLYQIGGPRSVQFALKFSF